MQVSLAPKIKEFEGRIGLAARICYSIHSTGFTLQIMHYFLRISSSNYKLYEIYILKIFSIFFLIWNVYSPGKTTNQITLSLSQRGCIFVHATVALRPFFTPDRIKVWKIQHTSARTGIHSYDASCRIQAEGCGLNTPYGRHKVDSSS